MRNRFYPNLTPAQMRLIVASAVLVNRVDHMTTEAFANGDARGEQETLQAAYAETDREVRRAPVGPEGQHLRGLHAAAEQLLLTLRTITAEQFAAGGSSLDTRSLATRLMAYGVSCPTRPDAFQV